MDFDFTQDITMILKNAAVVFSNMATSARESSATALKNPYNMSDPNQLGQIRTQSNQYLAAAAIWDARAATALKGNLLMGPAEFADPGYLSTFKDLITKCQKAGRLLIVTPLDKAVNNPMAIPEAGVPGAVPGDRGVASGPIDFDDKGNPKPSKGYPSLAKIPGQTTGFDGKGMPIIS